MDNNSGKIESLENRIRELEQELKDERKLVETLRKGYDTSADIFNKILSKNHITI